MITQTTNLNLIPGGVLPRINVSQYDKGSRSLVFNLYNGSVLFSVPSNSSVAIQGTKPDRTAFSYSCTYNGSTVTAPLELQMTVLAGEIMCEIVITKNNEVLGTGNFILSVEPASIPEDVDISETVLPTYMEAGRQNMLDAEAWAKGTKDGVAVSSTDPQYHNHAKYYAEKSSDYASNAATSATTATNKASAAATSASNAATSANNAAASESNAASSASTASTKASAAAQSASTTATKASEASTSASNAATSESNAALSESNAATSESNAATSESNAATSESNAADSATAAASSASTATTKASEAATSATNAAASASNASTSETNAATSETNANASALESEGYANGKQNGVDVGSGSPYYENNAKYFKELAEAAAQGIGIADMTGATATTDGSHGLAPGPHAGDQVKFLSGSGGYEKPIANNVLLASTLPIGGVDQVNVEGAVRALNSSKQDNLTFDDVPTAESDNPVKSGGVHSALSTKAADIGFYVNENGRVCQRIRTV